MRRVYVRLRVAVITFTLGLAAAWMANVFEVANRDYPVELPRGISDDVLFIFPVLEADIPWGGSGLCGRKEELTSDNVHDYFNDRKAKKVRREYTH